VADGAYQPAASFLEDGVAIGGERDLLAVLGRDLCVDVKLTATTRTDVEVVDSLDRASGRSLEARGY